MQRINPPNIIHFDYFLFWTTIDKWSMDRKKPQKEWVPWLSQSVDSFRKSWIFFQCGKCVGCMSRILLFTVPVSNAVRFGIIVYSHNLTVLVCLLPWRWRPWQTKATSSITCWSDHDVISKQVPARERSWNLMKEKKQERQCKKKYDNYSMLDPSTYDFGE